MRSRIATALVTVGILAPAAGVLAAPGDVIQGSEFRVAPTELKRSNFRNVELFLGWRTCFEGADQFECRSEAPEVPELVRVIFLIDRKDIELSTGEAKRCKEDPGKLAGMTPKEAKAACGKGSRIGAGNAEFNLGQSSVPANVTAFNGKKQGGRPIILLHSYAEQLQEGSLLVGVLKARNKLDLSVDPILNGLGRLQQLNVKIKKRAYVRARCSRGREITTTSKWTYRDAPTESDSSKQECEVRR